MELPNILLSALGLNGKSTERLTGELTNIDQKIDITNRLLVEVGKEIRADRVTARLNSKPLPDRSRIDKAEKELEELREDREVIAHLLTESQAKDKNKTIGECTSVINAAHARRAANQTVALAKIAAGVKQFIESGGWADSLFRSDGYYPSMLSQILPDTSAIRRDDQDIVAAVGKLQAVGVELQTISGNLPLLRSVNDVCGAILTTSHLETARELLNEEKPEPVDTGKLEKSIKTRVEKLNKATAQAEADAIQAAAKARADLTKTTIDQCEEALKILRAQKGGLAKAWADLVSCSSRLLTLDTERARKYQSLLRGLGQDGKAVENAAIFQMQEFSL